MGNGTCDDAGEAWKVAGRGLSSRSRPSGFEGLGSDAERFVRLKRTSAATFAPRPVGALLGVVGSARMEDVVVSGQSRMTCLTACGLLHTTATQPHSILIFLSATLRACSMSLFLRISLWERKPCAPLQPSWSTIEPVTSMLIHVVGSICIRVHF